MNLQYNLLDQLEGALSGQNLFRRAEVLRQVTDLFLLGSVKYSDDQIDMFGEVMSTLVERIECEARAAFGCRVAAIPDAPRKVIRILAFDDSIDVAGPVLKASDRLADEDLVRNATTKSQAHLLAISTRRSLPEAVTDVLVERGDEVVVSSTARNEGAKFSETGFSTLVGKSVSDTELAICVFARPDIPRQQLIKLFSQASESVRQRMETENPRQAEMIRAAVAAASEALQSKARTGSREHRAATSHVYSLHASGELDDSRILDFAQNRNFDRVAVALALKCDIPLGPVERALSEGRPEQILVFGKAIDLSWATVKALLLLRSGGDGMPKDDLDQCFASFRRLQPKTAQAALQFYRMRERAANNSGSLRS